MTASARRIRLHAFWERVGTRFLPFADAASAELPLARLLRLSLFQVSAGMALVLLTGTLNRVMIIELGVPTSLVAVMIAIPVLAAPFRVLIGHRSDNYRSVLGWRRVPYIGLGTMLQFGGLAIMPFALLLLESQTVGPRWAGPVGAGLAFLLTGAGMHMAQTAGLTLATDLATREKRPRVIALFYVTMLAGMILTALAFSVLLADFSAQRLIQVIQGAAVISVVLNFVALWKQEARNPEITRADRPTASFSEALAVYRRDPRAMRLLIAVALGSAAFSMQDVLLEPFGGEILAMSVGQTTLLTALWAAGALLGFAIAARLLEKGANLYRVAGYGALVGVFAFAGLVFAAPLQAASLLRLAAVLIGLGGGLFGVGTMLAAMELADESESGFAIGAWSAVQATAIGLALAFGGALRDIVNHFAVNGSLGLALQSNTTGYMVVYHLEIGLLFVSLIALGPLVGRAGGRTRNTQRQFGLAELPC